jgi:hypothetical protein
MADLVEYCWGDPYTTEWGRVRAADGHPAPYRVRYIELGNEQYNHQYIEQVAAMEARAALLGMPRFLYYLFPDNVFLNKGDDLARAKALGLDGLGDHMVMDIHLPGPAMGGAVAAQNFFTTQATGVGNQSLAGVINCEVNAEIHTMRRAMTEAIDLNQFFNYQPPSTSGDSTPRLKGRMASFCMGRSGHLESVWDQGIAFFSADDIWLQPPGWVHAMISEAWQPLNAAVVLHSGTNGTNATNHGSVGTCPGSSCVESASAAYSAGDVGELVVRYVNPTHSTVVVTVQFPTHNNRSSSGAGVGADGGVRDGDGDGDDPSWLSRSLVQLSSPDLDDANPANNTLHISPKNGSWVSARSFTAPPQSFTVAVFARAGWWNKGQVH